MANVINLNSIANTYLERSRLFMSYMDDIRKIPLLSKEEERSLLTRYRESDCDDEKIKIRNKLMKHNQLFIASAAKCYANNDVDAFLDLIGEVNLAFAEAIDSYDTTKSKAKLISWAAFYLRRAANYYNMRRGMVRLPYNDLLYTHYTKARQVLTQQEGRDVTDEEIFNYLVNVKHLPITDVNDVRQLQVSSIDVPFQDEDDFNIILNDFNTATSSLNHSEKQNNDEDTKTSINNALNCLNDREKEVIRLIYGLDGGKFDHTIESIAGKFECSTERVRQIKMRALKKLKAHLKETEKKKI